MDPLSQGVVGAAFSQSMAKKEEAKLAFAVGFGAGLLADIDVLIRSSADPLLKIEYHRHFTHSLVFIPLGGLLAASILWPFIKNKI
ncbi:MAG: metal-dependent hydrolase, partial [Halobacteriovoraceae bacterium]|nr:metal-dependent hydrolase [Halobacteriovoraceae bacterium]